jgi:hypothetical protein
MDSKSSDKVWICPSKTFSFKEVIREMTTDFI